MGAHKRGRGDPFGPNRFRPIWLGPWTPHRHPLPGTSLTRDLSSVRPPKMSLCFFFAPNFDLFFFCEGLLVELWPRGRGHGPPHLSVWSFLASFCASSHGLQGRFHKITPEKPKRAVGVVHGIDPGPQFREKTPTKEKRSKVEEGE